MIEIEIRDEQELLQFDADLARAAIRRALAQGGVTRASVSVAIVDDRAIHELNRKFLNHDEPTDVLSFVLEKSADGLDGEIIASAETAIRQAPRFLLNPPEELVLYLVHGALHLSGYDDHTSLQCKEMRRMESIVLAEFGIEVPSE